MSGRISSSAALDRRRLLLGLAAASSAAALPSIAMASAEVTVTENPALVRLGDTLPAAAAEYLAAVKAEASIVVKWSTHWPLAPDVLIKPYRDDAAMERTIDGAALTRAGQRWPMPVITAAEIQHDIDGIRLALRRKRRDAFGPINWHGIKLVADQWELDLAARGKLLAIAERHEADKAAVLDASGYTLAHSRMKAAQQALGDLVAEIMAQPEATMLGVVVKAHALAAWGNTDLLTRWSTPESHRWEGQLAASVLRLAGGPTWGKPTSASIV